MSTPGFYRIDGPPPLAPLYGLLPAAAAPAAGVRIVPDADDRGIERWGNGVVVWPYPSDTGEVTDACAPGSNVHEKGFGDSQIEPPEYVALTADVAATCSTYRVWNHSQWVERLRAVFDAVESSIIAREFMRGTKIPGNPHLADGEGVFPNNDTATSMRNAVALLEEQIALTGRQGLIHVSPTMMPALSLGNFIVDNKTGVLRTVNGTVIIADAGYAGGSQPTGHAASSGTTEWVYATGPVDVRRSEVFVMPDNPSQAVDRGTGGASDGRPNSVTYRIERYYVVDWDGVLQAAVLADRCQDTC